MSICREDICEGMDDFLFSAYTLIRGEMIIIYGALVPANVTFY